MEVNLYVWRAVIAAAVGAGLAGFHIGSINGMFEMSGFQGTFSELFDHYDNCSLHATSDSGTLTSEFENVTESCGTCTSTRVCGGSGTKANSILGVMLSIASVGATLGAFLSGWLSTSLGRRLTLSVSGLVMAVGSLLSAASFHSWLFTIGRGISGFSMGLSYGIVSLYISEVSPRKFRGRLTALIGPFYHTSLLLQFAGNCGFSMFCIGWRVSLTIQVAAGLFYASIMLLVPKTPRWLVLYNRTEEARVVLSKINSSQEEAIKEIEELKKTTDGLSKNYFKDLTKQFYLTVKWKYLNRLFLCIALFVCTTFIGNFTNYFTSTFFCKLSVDTCISNIIFGASLMIGGFLTSILMDKAGRKLILLVGSLMLLFLQVIMVSIIHVFNLEEERHDIASYVLTCLFCLYGVVYAGSWVTTPWVISSEVFPVETRGLHVAISGGLFWTAAAVSIQFTPVIINSEVGISGYLCMLMGVTVIAVLLVLLTLPETKGVGLESMDKLFNKPWLGRVNLIFYLSCGIKDYSNSNSEITEEGMSKI